MRRRASILILVVGIIAMLAALAVGFLARMRQDAGLANDIIAQAQNRLMLSAALTCIQESSRLGYAVMAPDGTCSDPREGWGWIDTRLKRPGDPTQDMTAAERIGPNDAQGRHLWTPGRWPAPGSVLRAPMFVMERPPYAVQPIVARNPIPSDHALPTFGIPFLSNPDPLPALPSGASFDAASPDLGYRRDWVRGDQRARPRSSGLAWFRLRREDGSEVIRDQDGTPIARSKLGPIGATFIITVGGGGTGGWRDWAEVLSGGGSAEFGGSEALFNDLAASEHRQWYRAEWSAAVGGGEAHAFALARWDAPNDMRPEGSWYEALPLNASRWLGNRGVSPVNGYLVAQPAPRNYIGTIRYVQRLAVPPDGGAW